MKLFFWPLNTLGKQLRVETKWKIIFKPVDMFIFNPHDSSQNSINLGFLKMFINGGF